MLRPAESNESDEPDKPLEVTLKPIVGISPRIYAPILWTLIAMALVFFLLIRPGINRNGTWLTVYSDPPDASIIADGIRLGRSYEPVFVPKGTRELRIKRSGFTDAVLDVDTGGRVFASIIVPRREEMTVRLESVPSYPLTSEGISEFAAWSAVGSNRERYAIPPSITMLSRDLTAIHSPPVDAQTLVDALLPMAREPRHLADINRGLYYLSFPQTIVNPVSLASYLGRVALFLDEPSNLQGLLNVAGGNDLKNPIGPIEDVYQETWQLYDDIRGGSEFPQSTHSEISFVTIPELSAVIGDIEIVDSGNYLPRFGAVPVKATLDSYQISKHEVSRDQFAAFILGNPYWSVENKTTLMEAGLVDKGYLEGWKEHSPYLDEGVYPVTDVSWHAAMAYTEWLSGKIFPSGDGRVRLPREDEWEVAARLNSTEWNEGESNAVLRAAAEAKEGEIGLSGMNGNVREWCYNSFRYNENSFRPLSGAPSYMEADSDLVGEDRAVRGAAFIDSDLPFSAAARGAFKAWQTSPVLGFRIVIP